MDSFDPFAGFATEMKASLPNGGIANGKAPSADEVSGGPQKIVPAAKANAPMPGGGNGGAYQRSPAVNPSQQPMMKGMPMMVMGGSGRGSAQESQHMFQQRNAPMPSFSSPKPTFQQPQPPMQWGPNNNSFQPQQQNFSTQQSSPAKYPHTQQNPAHSHLQSQLAPNQAPPKLLGVQPTQQQPVQPQFAEQQNTQQQLAQQQPTQKQPTQQQATQQQPIQRPTKMQFTQQNVQPYPQQQSWQQPLPPQQNEQEQDAIFCRIPSIVHAKTGDEGDVKDLRRTNSDDISQLNDDMSSFCPPPPPSVAPPPPPPSNEQAALEAVVPFTEQPATNQSNDVDIFGGLFDYPASPPFTPYDIENVKSMDSSPDGILASNPSIDDDYLFSDDDDDDDFFGIFGGDNNNKAPAATNSKSSDLSSTLGITKRAEEGREEAKGKSMKDNTSAAERSEKNKLPPGGEFYDCKVYTSTLGVMFFAPFELTDSLFRDMDRSSIVEALGQRPIVAHVLEQGAAKSVGVQVGHVLLQVNGKEVKTPQEANLAIRESSRPMQLLFYVLKEPINVAEGQYMVKYDTRDTGAPPTSRDWKPKYVVVGGIIAHSHMLNMYRSKAEYDVAVMDTQARRPVSVKVKQFTLKGARLWNEVGKENGISKPHVRKVKYRSQMKPWNYIVILPLKRDPIKISVPGSSNEKDNGLQQLKIVHEGIRQFIHGQSSNNVVATASATATEP